ncbi:MAG: hypothetical protein AB7O96_20095 [Pseudobdellovibrionaceae bacterium]
MKLILILLLFKSSVCFAVFDFGVGTSSVTAGRAIPSLALEAGSDSWGLLYRSEGVRTTIYSQNAWTLAGYKTAHTEKVGDITASIRAGLGATYLVRGYRSSPTAKTETETEHVIGPHLSVKFQYGAIFFGLDTLLGLTKDITQHLALNFQDVSHLTFGITL